MSDPVSFLSTLLGLVPNGLLITIVASALVTIIYVLRFALPTRMMESLVTSLHDIERIYYYSHVSCLESKADTDLTTRLIMLQDAAAKLRIQTLFHGTFFVQFGGELWGLCMGHSFAIWCCTRKIQCLSNELQLRQQEKFREFTRELPADSSPAFQLTMRHRYYSCSTDYEGRPYAGMSS
ncbi:hypothetical protein B0H13DRAFT_355295 [Mycena leptocephala]|nr:hypothetical protein B0H13DRAFT_355295 [Mycena leptocephala]